MFRKMRRVKNEISVEAAKELLRNNKRGALAVNGDDGYPYAVPIDFYYDEEENRIYFHSAMDGHKVDAVRRHDRASFCVVDQDEVHGEAYTTYYRSVIAFGRIRIVEDEAERLAAARLLGERYNPGHEDALQRELAKGLARMLVLCLDIEHMTGKEAIELTRRRQPQSVEEQA